MGRATGLYPSEQVSSLIDSTLYKVCGFPRLAQVIYFSLLVMLSKRKTSTKEGRKKRTEDEEKNGTIYIS